VVVSVGASDVTIKRCPRTSTVVERRRLVAWPSTDRKSCDRHVAAIFEAAREIHYLGKCRLT
jgi:phage portal protein BeeE